MQKVKMFVMPVDGVPAAEEGREALKAELMADAKKHIAKYAMPYDIEFRAELPKTLVGKVAYRVLEEEEEAKRKASMVSEEEGSDKEA
jgi:long-chain acyl-CoA synthetase